MGRTDGATEVLGKEDLGDGVVMGRCLGAMHASNMEMTDGFHGGTEGLEQVAWPRDPTLTDIARMWPGVRWPDEL
jgi:hypothetical protein